VAQPSARCCSMIWRGLCRRRGLPGERERLRQIIEEVALQQTGLVEEAQEVQLGKLAVLKS